MPYSVHYDSDTGIIMARLTGRIDIDQLRAYAADAISLAAKHECLLFINDIREAYFDISVSELDDIPQYASGLGLDSASKRAWVVKAASRAVAFLKSASRIRQQNVRLFQTVDAARQWLLDGTTLESDDQLNTGGAVRLPNTH